MILWQETEVINGEDSQSFPDLFAAKEAFNLLCEQAGGKMLSQGITPDFDVITEFEHGQCVISATSGRFTPKDA